MSLNTSDYRLDEIGSRTVDDPGLKPDLDILAEFIVHGSRGRHLAGTVALQLAWLAETPGQVTPPEGKVFVATVGARSHLSKPFGHDGQRRAVSSFNHGIVLGTGITAAAQEVVGNRGNRSWRFSTVALTIAKPELRGYGFVPDLAETTTCLHLGVTALGNLRALDVQEIPNFLGALHPLSESYTNYA